MLKTIRILGAGLCAVSLSACMIDGTNSSNSYQPYDSQPSTLYPEGYESTTGYEYPMESKKEVLVPDSYHVGAYHSPTPPKDLDRTWVSSQNPQGYTIEVADDEKAARVAGALQRAPKKEHMAEVKYKRNGQTSYKGLYGTYPSQEAAEQALSNLPEDVKQGASVKSWGSVQSNLGE